jgi:hypothetical protein
VNFTNRFQIIFCLADNHWLASPSFPAVFGSRARLTIRLAWLEIVPGVRD